MQIWDAVSQYTYDPYGYVLFAYPWGVNGSPLEHEAGPDEWQRDILDTIGRELRDSKTAVRIAVASGHGIGKTALAAWLCEWFAATSPDCQGVVTANTMTQLTTKTWRELAKWHQISIMRPYFSWKQTSYQHVDSPATWAINAVPWNKDRSEAFAGTHEKDVFILFDEASVIDDSIWEVSEGALTERGALMVAFGNPTRNTGRFRECFGKFKHRWITRKIDSRSASRTNKEEINKWIEDYGEDSDFVRIRVKGEFPRASSTQFIPNDVVDDAMARSVERASYEWAPIVLGVDVARFGACQSVIVKRQGLSAEVIWRGRGLDTQALAAVAIDFAKRYGAHAVFVDEPGVGAGVIDRMNALGHRPIAVNTGRVASEDNKFTNKRAEIWSGMKDWLKSGASLKHDDELKQDLIGLEYGFDAKNRLQLEKKEDLIKRGLASPDLADALALTFAEDVGLPEEWDFEEENAVFRNFASERSLVSGY